jgi:hypothetical protein
MQDGLNLPIYGRRTECVHVICEDEIAGGDRQGRPISYANVRFGDVFTLTFDRNKGVMHVKLLSGAYTKFMCNDANARVMLDEYEKYTTRRLGGICSILCSRKRQENNNLQNVMPGSHKGRTKEPRCPKNEKKID